MLLLFVFLISLAVCAEEMAPSGKLPRNVLPRSYDLNLTILPEQDTFSGITRIHLDIQSQVSMIWLHGKDLRVKETTIDTADGRKLSAKYTQVDDSGLARIDFAEPLSPQQATLTIQYEAAFDRKLEGLYRVDVDGQSYAFTQFEAISARRCFPSFDEPAFKTPYQITLTVRKEHEAVTNTLPVEETAIEGGLKRIRYEQTEKLPSYLLAFAVGPLDVVKGPDIPPNEFRKEPVPLRGIATRGKGRMFQYALQNTGGILVLLEQYFGIGYPFHKLDLIAIPDFEWGAMENAGAITFRETLLLMDEKTAPYDQKKAFAGVMAHEVGHQWFGDLVTLAWWDDIWLNEGLTSWIDGKIVQSWDPAQKADVGSVESLLRIMDSDSRPSTHPVHRPVKDSGDIASIADGIIFSKGAAIPLMFEHYLGENEFQKIIRHYLKKHQFGSVTTEDFLTSVREIAGNEAADSFHSFVYQSGVPFLEVKIACDAAGSRAQISQSLYQPLGYQAPSDLQWKAPVCVRFELNGQIARKCNYVSSKESSVVLSDSGCPSWIMPNAGGTGYYRWSLASDGLSKLRDSGLAKLTLTEQLSLVDSVKSAFAAGTISAAESLEALAPFASSPTRELALAPLPILRFFRDYLLLPENKPQFEKYVRDLYHPQFERLGFHPVPADTDETREFRGDVIDILAFLGRDPGVRSEAVRLGKAYVGFGSDSQLHPEAVDSNLLPVILAVSVQETGTAYVDALLAVFRNSDDSLVRANILSAIGRTTDSQLASRVRALSLDPELRTNEVSEPLESLLQEPANKEPTWNWVKDNFDALVSKLPISGAGAISYLGAGFCSDEKAEEVNQFLESRVKNLAGGTANLSRTLDAIRLCAAKARAHQQSANSFFAQQ